MSLTSYRAAPPRAKLRQPRKTCATLIGRDVSALGRPGNDLLSQVLRHSTIGADAFDGRVRNGIGSCHVAESHQAGEGRKQKQTGSLVHEPTRIMRKSCRLIRLHDAHEWASINENDQANRAISTGKLHTLLRVHTRPINVVVFHGSQGRTRFEVGFPLRCIQRLSRPYIATLHCGWRHNRSTRGTFIPVLSY